MRHDRASAAAIEREPAIHHPRAIIADDEAHLRDHLQAQLASAWPELRIVAKAANGLDALRLADEEAPDVVFLDIRMPGMTGLDVAARLASGERPPRIVFVTAYDQYAVDAFEHSAVDYLLKPASQERLHKTVAKLKAALRVRQEMGPASAAAPVSGDASAVALQALLQQLTGQLGAQGAAAAAPPQPPAANLQWIRAAHGDETRLIPIEDVIYFQSNDKYTSVFVAGGESLIRTPLSKLREQLDEQQFWQIHRSVIVAARHVAGTRQDFRGRLMVQLKGRPEQLVVSRNYVDLFRQM